MVCLESICFAPCTKAGVYEKTLNGGLMLAKLMIYNSSSSYQPVAAAHAAARCRHGCSAARLAPFLLVFHEEGRSCCQVQEASLIGLAAPSLHTRFIRLPFVHTLCFRSYIR